MTFGRVLRRRSWAAGSLLTLLALAALAASPVAAGARSPQPPRAKTILVKFSAGARAAAQVESEGDVSLGRTRSNVQVVELQPGETVRARIAEYQARGDVVYAEPNFVAHTLLDGPRDASAGNQWALRAIRAFEGWSLYPGAYTAQSGVKVAVVDTGVDHRHEDLNDGRVVTAAGANCMGAGGTCAPGSALDDHGHGTIVAGIVAAAANNGHGVAGIAFSSQIVPVKVMDSNGTGTYASITNGILWAARSGARVINLSLGGLEFSQTLCDAVAQARSAGALVVAAAGNKGTSAPSYPAACPGTVGVAATDANDNVTSFSNVGSPNVFVSAPGVSIVSTYLNNSYGPTDGTSVSAPIVSALGALLFGQVPARTPDDVKRILASTSAKVGGGYGPDPYGTCACTWSSSHGYGRIDVYSALAVAGGLPPSPPTSPPTAASPSAPPSAPASAPAPTPTTPATGDARPGVPPRGTKSAARSGRTQATQRRDVLLGTLVRDVLRALGGNDVIRSGRGNDRVDGGAGKDRIFAGRGDDAVVGGVGADLLDGGAGNDRLMGGRGNDFIWSRDGRADVVGCGRGRDTVVADRLDRVGKWCERVRRKPRR